MSLCYSSHWLPAMLPATAVLQLCSHYSRRLLPQHHEVAFRDDCATHLALVLRLLLLLHQELALLWVSLVLKQACNMTQESLLHVVVVVVAASCLALEWELRLAVVW